MFVDFGDRPGLADNPERLLVLRNFFPLWVIGDLLVEVDVVRENEDLFDVPGSGPHLVEETFDEACDDEEDVAVEARNGIIKDHDSVSCHPAV